VKRGNAVEAAITVDAADALVDRQLVRIDVLRPDGLRCAAYSTRKWIQPTGDTHLIPTALNDTRGEWRIHVTHVVTGLSAECAFGVQ
jgi:hypothetical protein